MCTCTSASVAPPGSQLAHSGATRNACPPARVFPDPSMRLCLPVCLPAHVRGAAMQAAEEQLFLASSIREELLGDRHPDCATTIFNLATVYDKLKLFNKATPLYLQVSVGERLALRRGLACRGVHAARQPQLDRALHRRGVTGSIAPPHGSHMHDTPGPQPTPSEAGQQLARVQRYARQVGARVQEGALLPTRALPAWRCRRLLVLDTARGGTHAEPGMRCSSPATPYGAAPCARMCSWARWHA